MREWGASARNGGVDLVNSPAASEREKVKIIEKGLLKNEKER